MKQKMREQGSTGDIAATTSNRFRNAAFSAIALMISSVAAADEPPAKSVDAKDQQGISADHAAYPPPPEHETTPRLRLLSREASQEGKTWIIWYRVQYEGTEPLTLHGSDIGIRYNASVSNSSLKSHIYPRESSAAFTLHETNAIRTTVIPSSNDRNRCKERVSVGLSPEEKRPSAPFAGGRMQYLPITLLQGQNFWLSLGLEHDHFIEGTFDPLLGMRELEIAFGPCTFIDTIDLTEECSIEKNPVTLSTPPSERRDPNQFRSAPDSLHLAADVAGHQYFRFDDMFLRHSTKFRLSFWYLIAVGSEGKCHARIMEYQDTPDAWYRLEGGLDEELCQQGKWRRFQQTFATRDDTTTVALDFRIIDSSLGEMWVDDVEITPLNEEHAVHEKTQWIFRKQKNIAVLEK